MDISQGFDPDRIVAEGFGKHTKTLARWDKNPALKELGWPEPVFINGRRHRPRSAIETFKRNIIEARLSGRKFGSSAATKITT